MPFIMKDNTSYQFPKSLQNFCSTINTTNLVPNNACIRKNKRNNFKSHNEVAPLLFNSLTVAVKDKRIRRSNKFSCFFSFEKFTGLARHFDFKIYQVPNWFARMRVDVHSQSYKMARGERQSWKKIILRKLEGRDRAEWYCFKDIVRERK